MVKISLGRKGGCKFLDSIGRLSIILHHYTSEVPYFLFQ